MSNDCPCHQCKPPDRCVGCHDNCKAYNEWSTTQKAESAAITAKKISDYIAAEPIKPKRIRRK